MAGSLYKRERLYYYDFAFAGKRYNASPGYEYKSQAQIVLRKKLAEIIDGKCRPNKRNHLKFNELAKQFLEWGRDHRKGTYRRDIQIVKHLNRFFDKVWIENITPIEIEKYMKQRHRDVSSITVNREVQTFIWDYTRGGSYGNEKKRVVQAEMGICGFRKRYGNH